LSLTRTNLMNKRPSLPLSLVSRSLLLWLLVFFVSTCVRLEPFWRARQGLPALPSCSMQPFWISFQHQMHFPDCGCILLWLCWVSLAVFWP
jgi:hypothetical protein